MVGLFTALIFSIPIEVGDSLRTDSLRADSLRVDTLREVSVRVDSTLRVEKVIDKSLKKNPVPKTMSMGDVLEKISPGINDKITHPFAIKDRKKERRLRRTKKILENFDRVKTFNELLDEAVKRQQLEDARQKRGSH